LLDMDPGTYVVKLSITEDSICPWCYIGWKEMERAIRQIESDGLPIKFDIEFKPFRLDPSLPEDTVVDMGQRNLAKFGPIRFSEIKKMVETRGGDVGIHFNWNGAIRQTGNSHRLIRHAYEKQMERDREAQVTTGVDGLHVKLLSEVFEGQFERAEDTGDPEILGGYCEKVGLMGKDEAISFLAGPEQRREVEEHFQEAETQGITGIPHIVIHNRWAIVGVQTSDVYYRVFEIFARQ